MPVIGHLLKVPSSAGFDMRWVVVVVVVAAADIVEIVAAGVASAVVESFVVVVAFLPNQNLDVASILHYKC